jgi:tRNA-binding protein
VTKPGMTTQSSEPGRPLGTTLRIGTIRSCRPNEGAKKPADVLEIDLGPLGVVISSAQLVARHTPEALVSRQVVVAMDLGTRMIAGVRSEVLVLGAEAADGGITLLGPKTRIPDGTLVH